MEWITNIKFPECKTNKEALDSAYQIIDNWCKANGFSWSINHNTEVGLYHEIKNANRCITIDTPKTRYVYKLTISTSYDYEIVEEETHSLFNKRLVKVEREIPGSKKYYAWLQRM